MKKKENEITIRSSAAEYLTFVAATGDSEESVEMRYEDENIWLTQKMMATLYDVSVPAINQHLKKIFADNELEPEAVIKKYLITASDGKNYDTNHYNLQAIIAVGFKVSNERAVQFRKWANQIVKDYTIQGWTMDVDRLKNSGSILTKEYFEKQLEKNSRDSVVRAGFGCPSGSSTKKSRTFTRPPWTTTPPPRPPSDSSPPFRTKCIGPFTATRPPS